MSLGEDRKYVMRDHGSRGQSWSGPRAVACVLSLCVSGRLRECGLTVARLFLLKAVVLLAWLVVRDSFGMCLVGIFSFEDGED